MENLYKTGKLENNKCCSIKPNIKCNINEQYETIDMFEKLHLFTANAVCNNKFAHCS